MVEISFQMQNDDTTKESKNSLQKSEELKTEETPNDVLPLSMSKNETNDENISSLDIEKQEQQKNALISNKNTNQKLKLNANDLSLINTVLEKEKKKKTSVKSWFENMFNIRGLIVPAIGMCKHFVTVVLWLFGFVFFFVVFCFFLCAF